MTSTTSSAVDGPPLHRHVPDRPVLPQQGEHHPGAFLPLEEIPGLVDMLTEAGVKLDKGWRTNSETGEKHLYGIPLADFPGLSEFLYTYEESYLSIAALNGNDENCVKFLNIFLQDMLKAPEMTQEVPAA